MITDINPYLIFNGTAEKAIQLYERVLGAKTEGLSRFGDVPGMNPPAEQRNRIIHAALHIGEGVVMVSDAGSDPVPTESNVHVSLQFDDAAEMAKKFEGLAAEGQVSMALADTFWGAKFGMLTDAFGIRWMFNCPHNA